MLREKTGTESCPSLSLKSKRKTLMTCNAWQSIKCSRESNKRTKKKQPRKNSVKAYIPHRHIRKSLIALTSQISCRSKSGLIILKRLSPILQAFQSRELIQRRRHSYGIARLGSSRRASLSIVRALLEVWVHHHVRALRVELNHRHQ